MKYEPPVKGAESSDMLITILMFVIAVACQLTDITLGPVKVWEILALAFFPFFIRRIEKKMLWFFTAFMIILMLSFLKGYFSDVHYYYYSTLKSKYVISCVRFIELTLCLVVALIPFNLVKGQKVDFDFIVKKFINFNFILTAFVLTLFIIDRLLNTSIVTYGGANRLRGFYVEGGPYGLFISTLIFLEMTFFQRKKIIAIFFIALILSQSKAGFIAATLFVLYLMIQKYSFSRSFLNPKNVIRFSIVIIFISLAGIGVTYKIANNYYQDIQNIDEVLKGRENDTSLVMGRIAASSIGPRIIEDNPFFGVGLGSYSLVRNNIQYRESFPAVKGWDLTGLGGFFNLLVENGLIGLLVFIFAIIKYFKFDSVGLYFCILFSLPFLLGAQLYMVYPWLYLGFYYAFKKSNI